jgi:hypothetical protein
VAAVAVAPRPVAAVPRFEVVVVVPMLVARWRQLPDLEGERWHPLGPKETSFPRQTSKRRP